MNDQAGKDMVNIERMLPNTGVSSFFMVLC